MKKLSPNVINERLSPRDITLVGEYLGIHTKTTFQCLLDHSWLATPSNILNGNGCPFCSNRNPLSEKIINERLKVREIEIINDYINSNSKSRFRCSKGHEWMATPGNILAGKGCPGCDRLSNESINERLVADGRGITMVGEYILANKKSKFQCSCGNIWESKISHVISGSGCPSCATYGFNPKIPAWEYAFTRGGYLKFGITNDLSRRLNEHSRHGEITLVHERYHEVGHHAQLWEKHIKTTYGGNYVSKKECPDGYTETLPLHLLTEIKSSHEQNLL